MSASTAITTTAPVCNALVEIPCPAGLWATAAAGAW